MAAGSRMTAAGGAEADTRPPAASVTSQGRRLADRGDARRGRFRATWGWPREATITAVRVRDRRGHRRHLRRHLHAARRHTCRRRTASSLASPPTPSSARQWCQFADQYLDCRDGVDGRNALDPEQDRLVLVVGNTASGNIREHLRNVLDRMRDWPADKPLLDAASNDQEKDALEQNHRAHQPCLSDTRRSRRGRR